MRANRPSDCGLPRGRVKHLAWPRPGKTQDVPSKFLGHPPPPGPGQAAPARPPPRPSRPRFSNPTGGDFPSGSLNEAPPPGPPPPRFPPATLAATRARWARSRLNA